MQSAALCAEPQSVRAWQMCQGQGVLPTSCSEALCAQGQTSGKSRVSEASAALENLMKILEEASGAETSPGS